MRLVKDGHGNHRHLGGWRKDLPDHRDRKMSVSLLSTILQPKSASLYPLMAQISVYDQLGEGSCTANMGCAQVKHLLARAGKLSSFEPSRQDLYKSVRISEGTPLTEDSGAQIRSIFQALRVYGVAPEADDPYSDAMSSWSAPRSDFATKHALDHQALLYLRCSSLRTIKASILAGFPVGFGFTCFESLMSAAVARTGLVPFPEKGEASVGGHANLVIGYDDDKVIGPYTGAFLSRNSWGKNWGDGGDLWLPYRYFTTGLADDCWTLRREEMP
jgi:C1A family cysteine protease